MFSTVSLLSARIRCRGVRAVSVPNTIRKTPSGELGRFGATMFEVYGRDSVSHSLLNIRRSVCAANDGGRWVFDANGVAFEFEQPERYKARRIRDRFTPELLEEYLAHLGIRVFEPDFYESPQPAILVSEEGPSGSGFVEYSLDEARLGF